MNEELKRARKYRKAWKIIKRRQRRRKIIKFILNRFLLFSIWKFFLKKFYFYITIACFIALLFFRSGNYLQEQQTQRIQELKVEIVQIRKDLNQVKQAKKRLEEKNKQTIDELIKTN